MSLFKSIKKKLKRKKQIKPTASTSDFGLEQQDFELVEKVVASRLTYLRPKRLASIVHAIDYIEKSKIPGDILEAGCALGGSAILMAKKKSPERPLRIYDVFEMIPPPGEKDGQDVQDRYEEITSGKSQGIGADTYYGYEENLLEKVKNSFRNADVDIEQSNVLFFKGLLQDTMIVNEPIALAHIDVDWYDPVLVSLERIVPRLSTGGMIIIDDYKDWSGCRDATDAYFEDKRELFDFDTSYGSLKISRRN